MAMELFQWLYASNWSQCEVYGSLVWGLRAPQLHGTKLPHVINTFKWTERPGTTMPGCGIDIEKDQYNQDTEQRCLEQFPTLNRGDILCPLERALQWTLAHSCRC